MTAEETARMHQRSFRVAFDFLASHFPPQMEPEWWEQTAKDCSAASLQAQENQLVLELLSGVMEYLGKEYHRRKENGETEN